MTTRVLHICDFAAPYPGAFIRQLRLLDDVMRGDGPRQTALAFPRRAQGQPWLDDLYRDGFQVFLLDEPTLLPKKETVEQIKTLITELDCNIVHSHFAMYDQCVAAAVGGTAKRKRPVQIWHYRTALETPVAERSLSRRFKDFIKFRWYGRGVDRCVGVTEAMALEARQRGMGQRAVAVVSGCDTDLFRQNPRNRQRVRKELGLAADAVMILHMGWAWQRKGGDLFARALQILDQRGYSGIVGLSIGAPALEVEEPVHSIPTRTSVYELHQASDIFVSPSRSEGFGNGLIEAMACERVAAAAVADGQRELFSGLEGCRTAEVGSATSLADGLQWLLDNRDQWRALGEVNRERVVERYSLQRWGVQMNRLYDELLGQSHSADDMEAAA